MQGRAGVGRYGPRAMGATSRRRAEPPPAAQRLGDAAERVRHARGSGGWATRAAGASTRPAWRAPQQHRGV